MKKLLALLLVIPLLALAEEGGDIECRVHLKKLGNAVRAYKLIHDDAKPAKLSDLFLDGLVTSLGDFTCPASGTAIADSAGIDAKSDYTFESLPGAAGLVVREKKPNHAQASVLALLADGTVKALSVPGAPPEQAAQPAAPAAQPPPAVQPPPPVAQPPVASQQAAPPAAPGVSAPPPINVAGQPPAVPAINPPALPGSRMDQLTMIVAAVWSNHVGFAAQQLKQMMTAYPGDAEIARYWILIQLAAGGDNAGAKAVADRLLVTHPADAQILMAHGQAALFNKDQAGAIRSIHAAHAMAPFLINGIYDEANRLRAQGVHSVAYIQYISLTWLNPPSSGAFYGLGCSASAIGRREEAIEAFERFLKMEPRSTFAADVQQRLAQLRRQ